MRKFKSKLKFDSCVDRVLRVTRAANRMHPLLIVLLSISLGCSAPIEPTSPGPSTLTGDAKPATPPPSPGGTSRQPNQNKSQESRPNGQTTQDAGQNGGSSPSPSPSTVPSPAPGVTPPAPAPAPAAAAAATPPPPPPPPPPPQALCNSAVDCGSGSFSSVTVSCAAAGANAPQPAQLYTGTGSCPKIKAVVHDVGLPSGNAQIPPNTTGGSMLLIKCMNGFAQLEDGNRGTVDYEPVKIKMPAEACTEFRDRLNGLKLNTP